MTTPKPPSGMFKTQPVTIDLCAAARESHLDGPVGVLWKEPNPGEFWQHFKGGIYRIVTIATVEATGDRVVIYTKDTRTWSRPLSEFLGNVTDSSSSGCASACVGEPSNSALTRPRSSNPAGVSYIRRGSMLPHGEVWETSQVPGGRSFVPVPRHGGTRWMSPKNTVGHCSWPRVVNACTQASH